MRKKIGIISLGCDKNRTDTEKMLGKIASDFDITGDPDKADVIIINTCAFIESARKEAIEEILSAIELKKQNPNKKIVVTGCLPQRFLNELVGELPEVDAFLGVSDYGKTVEILKKVLGGERAISVEEPKDEGLTDRVLTTSGYAYLKIADGCSNHCTFCTIPLIRGKYRSARKEDLIEEASKLGNIKELILVAQDTLKYGEDLTPKTNVIELLRGLSALRNVGGIRLLYCYPENITDELIHEFATNPKIIRYMDIPFQHADSGVLKKMGRKGTRESYLDLIRKLRERVPGIAIRSTFMTGFPGEDDAAFNNLVGFIKEAKLDSVGFFKYSREEGTPAFNLPDQVCEGEKTKRYKKLYAVQKKVVKENAKKRIGNTVLTLAEGFDDQKMTYYGRAYFSAPEVDGKIFFFSSEEVKYGEYVRVKIRGAIDYDLYGDRV